MSRCGWIAAVFVGAATVGVAAGQGRANTAVTVMGCVQNISSTNPAGETTRGFLLSNVTTGDEATATAIKGRPATASTSYLLVGRDGDLKAHVGHKIEVTGTLDAKAETTGDQIAAPPTAGPGAKSMDQQQRLHVSAVRMVAPDCLSK